MTIPDALLDFRSEFPILERCTYMVSNSLGAMPHTVPERLAEYADQWATHGVRAWAKGWWSMPLALGDEIAPLIGAGAGEVAMVPTVSMAQAAILSALDFRNGRDTIVMTALDFPSVRYVFDELAPKLGARVVVVPSDDGLSIDEDRLCAAIDERTAVVAISHVLFRSAYIMDVARITAHAHKMGALVALDAYHSVGVMPVDVHAIGAVVPGDAFCTPPRRRANGSRPLSRDGRRMRTPSPSPTRWNTRGVPRGGSVVRR